jgi:hypothetical protein
VAYDWNSWYDYAGYAAYFMTPVTPATPTIKTTAPKTEAPKTEAPKADGGGVSSNGSTFTGNGASGSLTASVGSGNGSVVSSTSGLIAALKTAAAGDTIQLAPGTYSGVSLKNLNFASAVTITSQDTGHQAVLTDLNVSGSHGLNLTNLEFAIPTTGTWSSFAFKIANSSDVHIVGADVHGILDGDATTDMGGFNISGSSYVSIEDSEFHELGAAITNGSNDHVTISGNSFHDIRIDGIENTGSSFVTIDNNYFTAFQHLNGDHSDAIQFWTTGRNASVTDINISNNLIVQGSGAVMQGVFIQDEEGNLPFHNVAITGNAIVGGNWNGINVSHADNVTITGNTVIPVQNVGNQPWIKLVNVDNATVTNNQASSFALAASALSQSNNVTLNPAKDGGASALDGWFGNHLSWLENQDGAVTSGLGALGLLPGGGSFGDDSLTAASSGDLVYGMGGNDRVFGGGGADHLYGGGGADTIVGRNGADWIEGGPGSDIVAGDNGADTFVWRDGDFSGAPTDTIVDFSTTDGDRLDLSRVDANTLSAKDDPFTFIGSAAFHQTAGELRYSVSSGTLIVQGDLNGDGVADFSIKLVGISALSASSLNL